MIRATLLTLLVPSLALAADPAPCRLPEAPAAFLDLFAKERKIEVKEGSQKFVREPDILDGQSDIIDIFNSCRMTPVEITGDDPLTHQPRPVTAMSYAPKGSDPAALKTVLLLPPTGGENILDDAYAIRLCDDGMRVVLVQHWTGDMNAEEDLDMHDRNTMRATAAIEDVINYIAPRGPSQLGLLGTSVGAITGALVQGVDARISASTLIVGGGGMPEIIGHSSEKTLAALRKQRMADLHFATEDDYVKALADHVKIEPLNFVKFSRQKKNLFFMGLQDVTVPTANQRLLYEALGSQELVTHEGDHIHTILRTSLTQKGKISDFFQNNLAAPTSDDHLPESTPGNLLCRNAREQAPANPAPTAPDAPAPSEANPAL